MRNALLILVLVVFGALVAASLFFKQFLLEEGWAKPIAAITVTAVAIIFSVVASVAIVSLRSMTRKQDLASAGTSPLAGDSSQKERGEA